MEKSTKIKENLEAYKPKYLQKFIFNIKNSLNFTKKSFSISG